MSNETKKRCNRVTTCQNNEGGFCLLAKPRTFKKESHISCIDHKATEDLNR